MKSLLLVLCFCFLMTKTQASEVGQVVEGDEEKIEYWYLDVKK